MGWTIINEEAGADGTGALERTYVGKTLAHADGTNPGTGTWRYYHMDAQGSVGLVTDPSHTGTAGGGCSRRRSPTGPTANGTPAPAARWTTNRQRHLAAHRYAQLEWDPTVVQYYAPYRWYHPRLSRWTTRDPLGMVDGPNVYAYVKGDPVNAVDPMGHFLIDLWCDWVGWGCDDDDPAPITGGDVGNAAENIAEHALGGAAKTGAGNVGGGALSLASGLAGAAPGVAVVSSYQINFQIEADNVDDDPCNQTRWSQFDYGTR